MSKVSDVTDALYSLVGTALSTYNELSDPYELENNTELFLRKGYGIAINDGMNNLEQSTSCHRWTVRTYTFSLVNKITTTRENKTSMKTLQKSIMEDQETVLQAIYDDSTLGGDAVHIEYQSDTGIQYLDIEQIKYFRVDTTLEVTYIKTV